MFQLSNLKKFGMELQCSKNEMVQTNVLKILFNFYSTLSSPLTLSLLSRGGSLVEVNGRSLWAIGNSLWVVNKWFNLLSFGWFQGSVVVLVFEACGLWGRGGSASGCGFDGFGLDCNVGNALVETILGWVALVLGGFQTSNELSVVL